MTTKRTRSSTASARANGSGDDVLRAALQRWDLPALDLALLHQALVHSSAVEAHSVESNERLEFLGDSILNAAAAEFLYREYPEWPEGDLAKGRALVVSKLSLYEVGVRLGLPDLISVGSNTEGTLARSRRSLAADAVEALIATVYLQLGWEEARRFVLRILEPELAGVRIRRDLRDPKTILQERAQGLKEEAPVYEITAEAGDPHSRTFTAQVHVSGVVASGSGRSKKDAQQAAAAAALQAISEQPS